MTLAQFLDSSDVDKVFIFSGWKSTDSILYDGDYDKLVSILRDKDWSDAEIMRWSVTGRVAMIEIRVS